MTLKRLIDVLDWLRVNKPEVIKEAEEAVKQSKKAKKPTVKKGNLVGVYVDAFRLRYQCDPVITGKTGRLLQDLLKSMSFEKAQRLIQGFLTLNDQFFVKKRHPVELLITNLNQIQVTIESGSFVTSKTARQVEEVDSTMRAAEKYLGGR